MGNLYNLTFIKSIVFLYTHLLGSITSVKKTLLYDLMPLFSFSLGLEIAAKRI